MSSHQIPVFLRNYCPYCDKELSDPKRLVNHLNKVEKRGMPARAQCDRGPHIDNYIIVRAKSEAQSLRNACPSCWEHFPVNLPRKVLQDHFQEAHLTRSDNEASLSSSAVLSPAFSDSSDSAFPVQELLDEQTHAKHEFLNALDRLVITLKNLILKE